MSSKNSPPGPTSNIGSKAPSKKLTSQLRKNYITREVGVLKNLDSGTFKRLATPFSSKNQRPPKGTSYVTRKR